MDLRAPVGPRVAHGAVLVRLTATSYTTQVRVAAITAELLADRKRISNEPSTREAKIARFGLIALVPLLVVGRATLDPGWFVDALTSVPAAVILSAAIALTAVGSWWTWTVTTPPYTAIDRHGSPRAG